MHGIPTRRSSRNGKPLESSLQAAPSRVSSQLKQGVEHVFNVLIPEEDGHAGSVPHVFNRLLSSLARFGCSSSAPSADRSALGFIDRKRLADHAFDDQSRANAFCANSDPLGRFTDLHPQGLQIRAIPAAGDPRGLATVAAEVFRLAAFNLLVSLDRLLPTDGTLGTHDTTLCNHKNFSQPTNTFPSGKRSAGKISEGEEYTGSDQRCKLTGWTEVDLPWSIPVPCGAFVRNIDYDFRSSPKAPLVLSVSLSNLR
jgi:hypothetical protein